MVYHDPYGGIWRTDAIGVVVDHEELLADEGGGALAVDLDGLLHHVALDSGERVVAMGGDAVRAIGAVVAEVALAALDLAGVPKLVLLAVVDVGVGAAGDDVGGDEGLLFARLLVLSEAVEVASGGASFSSDNASASRDFGCISEDLGSLEVGSEETNVRGSALRHVVGAAADEVSGLGVVVAVE